MRYLDLSIWYLITLIHRWISYFIATDNAILFNYKVVYVWKSKYSEQVAPNVKN